MNTKKCTKCGEEKKLEDFTRREESKDGHNCACRECTKKYMKDHYRRNKDYYIKKARKNEIKYRKIYRDFIVDYLKNHPCIDCGEEDIVVLEFDHREKDEKEFNISSLSKNGFKLKLLKNEIDKCDVRCANCHRRKTAKDYGWYRVFWEIK